MSETVFETISKDDAVAELQLWLDKGHAVMEAFQVIKDDAGGLLVGIVSYADPDEISIPEHLGKPYSTYKGVFGAFGSLVDAME